MRLVMWLRSKGPISQSAGGWSMAVRSVDRAFSLVELVIVLVIIGIVAAIAVPRITRGATRASAVALRSDLATLRNAIELAEIVVHCALHRDECRGAHYKPQFHTDDPPEGKASPRNAEYMRGFSANNERWLKTSMAEYTPDGPKISYEKVDVSLIEPVPRHYE